MYAASITQLVPNAHLDEVENSVDKMIGARSWLWTFIVFMMVINILQLGQAVFTASALDPTRMLKIYGGLVSAALNTLLSSSLLLSMFGIYYDTELGLPVVNYVPGWAYQRRHDCIRLDGNELGHRTIRSDL